MWIWMLSLALAGDPEPVDTDATESSTPTAEDVTPEEEADSPDDEESASDESGDGAEPPEEAPVEPEPVEEPVVYTIEMDDSELGSALDGFSEKSERYRRDDPERLKDAEWRGLRPQLFRGRWFVKPVLAWATLQGKAAVPLGIAVGHQWFPTSASPFQIAGESRLDVSAPVGGAKGRSVQLASTLGPWVGPIGLRAGPVVRYDRWESDSALLDDALAMGIRATAGIDAKYLKPWVGVEPVWLLAGDRDPWGAIGELSLLGGVQYAGKAAHLGLSGILRQTSAGPFVQLAFTVHVRPR